MRGLHTNTSTLEMLSDPSQNLISSNEYSNQAITWCYVTEQEGSGAPGDSMMAVVIFWGLSWEHLH